MSIKRGSTEGQRDGSSVGVAAPKRPKGLRGFLSGIRTFDSLRYRDFRYLWLGQISNSASLWMEQVARPVLVLSLTGSAVHLGLVLAARVAPQLGFGMIAGVIADTYDRRKVMLISKGAAMLLNFFFALLILSGKVELWHIYATSVLKGIAVAFDNPARQALIPSLVPPQGLTNAVSFNTASMQMMRIGGAFFAGLALAAVGVGGTFLAVAAIYVGSLWLTYQIRPPRQVLAVESGVRAATSGMKEGFKYAWSQPVIRGLLVLMVGYFILGMAYLQVFAPLFAKQVLGIGDAGFGFLTAASGVGALVGALVVATYSPTRWRGPIMLAMMGLVGLLLAAFALSTYTGQVPLTFVAIGFVGLFQSPFFALVNSSILEITPDTMRGRIMGVMSLDRSMIVLGGSAAGFLAAALGPQLAQIAFGLGLIVLAVTAATFMPSLRRF